MLMYTSKLPYVTAGNNGTLYEMFNWMNVLYGATVHTQFVTIHTCKLRRV